jgi:hypothetical protein
MDKIVPVLAEKIGEAQTPLIEDEIKKCIETHVIRRGLIAIFVH